MAWHRVRTEEEKIRRFLKDRHAQIERINCWVDGIPYQKIIPATAAPKLTPKGPISIFDFASRF